MMTVKDEICWLCGKECSLTRAHYPPASARNEAPLTLQGVSEESFSRGEVVWEDKHQFADGLWKRSICEVCNGRAGRKFAPSYKLLVQSIMKEVSVSRRFRSELTVKKLHNARLILKQIIHQFVSVNGPGFASANPWVMSSLESSRPFVLPKDVFIYAYVTRQPLARMSGISGQIDVPTLTYSINSEFAFPPLGTVISYGPLRERRLAPIRHWSTVPKGEPVDITFPINNVLTPSPLDFRCAADIRLAAFGKRLNLPSEELVAAMISECERRSGQPGEKYHLVGLKSAARYVSPHKIYGEL